VRTSVARNRAAPVDVIARLATDPAGQVRSFARFDPRLWLHPGNEERS
jgi:hypothetical protein